MTPKDPRYIPYGNKKHDTEINDTEQIRAHIMFSQLYWYTIFKVIHLSTSSAKILSSQTQLIYTPYEREGKFMM
jgi:hypothetical protein